MNCPICNEVIEDGSNFCPQCGGNVVEALAAQAEAQARAEAEARAQAEAHAQVEAQTQAQAQTATQAGTESDSLDAGAQYAEAKAQFKAAKKAAGKSSAPKVIGLLLGAVLLVGAGGGAAWYLMTQEQRELDSKAAEAQKAVEDATAAQQAAEERAAAAEEEAAKAREEAQAATEEAESAKAAAGATNSAAATSSASSSAASSSSAKAESEDNIYVGKWTGKLVDTSRNYACYGAQEKPIEVTIKSIDELGKMKVDVKVLYHGHDKYDLTSDVDNHSDDIVQEFEGLTTTLSDNSFKLVIPENDIENAYDLEISAAINKAYSTGTQMEVVVKSGIRGTFSDSYVLTKAE